MATVSNLINQLTSDEDSRQNLWLSYLNGSPIHDLPSVLGQSQERQALVDDIESRLARLASDSSDRFFLLLSHFSPFEQSIMGMLTLGFTISQISEYHSNVGEVRIKQAIALIRRNPCWKELYGTQEEAY